MKKRVYLDYNATTPLAPEVLHYLENFQKNYPFNASSLHLEGRLQRENIEESRRAVAKYLDCLNEEVCFMSGATEANNTVFHSVWNNRKPSQNIIISTPIEHDAVLACTKYYETQGAQIEYLKINSCGEIDLDHYKAKIQELSDQVLLVSVMMVNNETGIILPIKEITQLAHSVGAYTHSDAACAVGKLSISFKDLGLDFLSFSGHKVYALPASGALLVKRGVPFTPLLLGGGHERGKRAGTENSLSIGSIRYGLDFAYHNFDDEKKRLDDLRKYFFSKLKKINHSFEVIEHSQNQISSTICLALENISSQTLLANLDIEGISVSGGSACQSGSLNPSHVLEAMKVPNGIIENMIRISFGRLTTSTDIDYLIEKLSIIIKRSID